MRFRLLAAALGLSLLVLYTTLILRPHVVYHKITTYEGLDIETAPRPVTADIDSDDREGVSEEESPEDIPVDLEPKYFSEPGEGGIYGHYDSRFFPGEPHTDPERSSHQRHLLRAYVLTLQKLGIETWLAHGTLLGWYWNQHVLPWDGDLDVQVKLDGLEELAKLWNNTQYTYAREKLRPSLSGDSDVVNAKIKAAIDEEEKEEHEAGVETPAEYTYLLDVNPYYYDRVRTNWMPNIIDARFIDVNSGLFIDITGLGEMESGKWSAKDEHVYLTKELFPLQKTVFESVEVYIPRLSREILEREYSSGALKNTHFEGYTWTKSANKWIKDPEPDSSLEPVSRALER